MSLKAFHVVFITASILLSFGFGYWGIQVFVETGQTLELALGIGSVLAGIGLVFYERYFLKKHKHIGYI